MDNLKCTRPLVRIEYRAHRLVIGNHYFNVANVSTFRAIDYRWWHSRGLDEKAGYVLLESDLDARVEEVSCVLMMTPFQGIHVASFYGVMKADKVDIAPYLSQSDRRYHIYTFDLVSMLTFGLFDCIPDSTIYNRRSL
jgi:hypothetical protein